MQVPRKARILVAIAAVVAITIALFDWNWLRGPFAAYMSAKLGRPVTIDGTFHVALSTEPLITADSVTIGNPRWSTEPVMARAQRVAFRINLASIYNRPFVLPEVNLAQPRLLLEKSVDGHANWEFEGQSELPLIGRLNIEDGVVHYLNPGRVTDVTVNVQSSASAENGEMPVHFTGSGRLRDNAFTIEGTAASLLLLEEQNRPYRLDMKARAGDTSVQFNGTVVPTRLDTVDGTLALQGRDLSQLYPIIPVPFPWTPPYRLTGKLKHDNKTWFYREFSGKVGDSDLAGNFSVDPSKQRPLVDADLVSERLNYKDLGGVIGLPPANEPPSARTAAQNKEAARREQTGRVLPSKPYDLERLRAVDAKLRLKGKRFMMTDLPLDNVNSTLDLQDGVLKLQPLDFGVGGGHVTSTLVLDARDKVIKTNGDVTVRNVELKEILPAIKPPKGSAGKVGGRARFAATGNSIADMLATSNGEVALVSWGGDASELAIVLTNLDLARAAQLLLRGDQNSSIHCVVADFVAENGVMSPRTLIVDTEAERILGSGTVDFANERYDLRLNAQSKKASLIALRGPIVVDGTFKSPHVGPAVGPLAARIGTSVALGALAAPAALLPLIDFGGAPDADCSALVQDAKDNVQARSEGAKLVSKK